MSIFSYNLPFVKWKIVVEKVFWFSLGPSCHRKRRVLAECLNGYGPCGKGLLITEEIKKLIKRA